MENEKVELKPCPFCGGSAEIQYNEYWGNCSRHPHVSYTVGCHTDGCVCEVDSEQQPYESEIKAVEAWNRRIESLNQIDIN